MPTIQPGQSLTFHNVDAVPAVNAFHTITACKDPCTGKTGIAYPIANGPVTFDSGELGTNGNQGSIGGAPASGTDHLEDAVRPPGRHLHLLLPDPSVHEGLIPRREATQADSEAEGGRRGRASARRPSP